MKTPPSKWQQRLGYGVGDLSCNLIWQMMTVYLMFFYTDIILLSPADVAFILMGARLIDSVGDIIMGRVIDRTKSRWGKSRPYFLFGAIPFGLLSVATFWIPDIQNNLLIWYAFITYTLLSLAYTVVNMPLTSILPALTNISKERTILATSRMIFSFIGATLVGYSTLPLVKKMGSGNEKLGFQYTIILYAVLAIIFLLFTFFSVREDKTETATKLSFKDSLSFLRQHKTWHFFAINLLFMWSAFFLQQGSLIYFYTYYIQRADLIPLTNLLVAGLPLVGTLLIPFFIEKHSKKRLFLTSSLIHLLGLFIMILNYGEISLLLIGTAISSVGFGARHVIYFTLQADLVDDGIQTTGVNGTGLIAAINQFLGKFSMAAAAGVSGFILSSGNYQAGLKATDKSQLSIFALFLLIPTILVLISIILMNFYPKVSTTKSK